MQDGEARIVWQCPYWRVEQQDFCGLDGRVRQWYTARRPNPHTVHMLGLTPDGLTPVLRQWRVPMQAWVWELPAGLCDMPDEPIAEAARRELLEETGWHAGELHHLLCATVSPGLTDELYNAFLCLDLQHAGDGGGTGGERLQVQLVAFDELQRFFLAAAARGELIDAKLLTHIELARLKLAELGLAPVRLS
jgi:ADP-ribose pyrophosphatase